MTVKSQAEFNNNKLHSEQIHTALLLYGSLNKLLAVGWGGSLINLLAQEFSLKF